MNFLRTLFLLAVVSCSFFITGYGAVIITPATGGTAICAKNAVTGSTPTCTTLGNIIIKEVASSDFSAGFDTLVLHAPIGWQFCIGATITFTDIAGRNITSVTVPTGGLTDSTLMITVAVTNTNRIDRFTIIGLKVQALTTTAPSGYIYASYVAGMAGIVTGTSDFADLALSPLLVPSVSITASPGDTVCPGTSVTFTPIAINGGAPTFHWYLNNVLVFTGATYTNSSLTNGNTISCRMAATGCVTTTTAYSDTLTMSISGPALITGTTTVCPGTTTTLSDATSGGSWSSSNTAIATIDATTGIVTAITAGTTTISYTSGLGCPSVTTLTVSTIPTTPVVTPSSSVICNGTSVMLTAAGSYLSTTPFIQNFNSGLSSWSVDNSGSIGTVSGAAWGTYSNGYSNSLGTFYSPDSTGFVMTNADTSGTGTTTASLLISPSISLVGYTSATLQFQQNYNYSPNDVMAEVDISTDGGTTWAGVLANYKSAGISVGAANAFATASISLSAYTGLSNLKIRFNYNSVGGSYWAIDNVSINATPVLAQPTWTPTTNLYTNAGLTIPYTTGTATDTVYVYPTTVTTTTPFTYYTNVTNGICSATDSAIVTVNPTPASITGANNVCVGQTSTLHTATSGGTWSSSNTSIATINTSGIVLAILAGGINITYTSISGCITTTFVTVNPLPAAITGTPTVCEFATTSLSETTPGGTWWSGNILVSTIDGTGNVTGVVPGTDTITYLLSTGCFVNYSITVNPLPASITGVSKVCSGAITSLNDATTSGTWTSSNTAIATVNSLGIVTGIASGNAVITYTLPTSCFITNIVTVNPLPSAITGINNVCIGLSSTLSDTTTGGTWSISNATLASVSGIGVVTGLSAGADTINYTLGTGCASSYIITINPLPATITGSNQVCTGATTTLGNASIGGTWTSSNIAVAAISGTGVVSGIATGTALITYTLPTGCLTNTTITVNPVPNAITGSSSVCLGLTNTLSESSTGGSWSVFNTTNAIITGTGVVLGVIAGVDTVAYTFSTGCKTILPISINIVPSAITGTTFACAGATTSLNNTTVGGTWTSNNTAIASIDGTGLVTGVAAGNTTITYTLGGCSSTTTITINPLPNNITGSNTICEGATSTLSETTLGGTWSMTNTTHATVSSGIVTGILAGTDTVVYTLGTGCNTMFPITINASPASITGITSVCMGGTTSLSNTSMGGTWTSNNTAIATIGSTGLVTGVSAGVTTITYSLSGGCNSATTITVNSLPNNITGSNNICEGATSTLSETSLGGTWSMSNTTHATVSGGIVNGILAGTDTVVYTLGTGCNTIFPITINATPASITGITNVCMGGTTSLSNTTVGGTWASNNTAIATIDGTGLVTGIASGITTITYTLSGGCNSTTTITVNSLPNNITGSNTICEGATTTLSETTLGGTWSMSNTTHATVSSGVVTGILAGTDTVVYTLGTGCNTMYPITINATPASITGSSSICLGANTSLSDIALGGTWTSSNTAIASIDGTGLVTSAGIGSAIISYTLSTGCFTSKSITVNPLPSAITGSSSVCEGLTTTLSETAIGGTWSVSNSNALVTGSGVVLGITAGVDTVVYTLGTGCNSLFPITINATPASIAGITSVCIGATTTLSNTTLGGTWASNNTAIATIDGSTGLVTSASAGTTTITYTLTDGCIATTAITVNALPNNITGSNTICEGATITLSETTLGGSWSMSNASHATISSGIINGILAGIDTVVYTLGTGCITMYPITINATPASIAGITSICIGATSMLSNTVLGGIWASNDTTIASIDGTGLVTSVASGITTITYTLAGGCIATTSITVNSLPNNITGSNNVCEGATTTLSETTLGGTWSMSNATHATISSGIVTGILAGIDTVVYTLGTGCNTMFPITINATPASITGTSSVCMGATTALGDVNMGGTWASSNTAIATIDTAGNITGLGTGSVSITYTLPAGCFTNKSITVNAIPATITGSNSVCEGLTTTLSEGSTGGAWSVYNPTDAFVTGTGVVLGIIAGVDTVAYTFGSTGCKSILPITINATPASITGTTTLCVGATTTLSNTSIGGTWFSSNTALATINSSGVVSGITAGTVTISYILTGSCTTTILVTINPLPAPITGSNTVCEGQITTLTETTLGGTWSISNTTYATISSGIGIGIVTGILAGIDTVVYTLGTGCNTIYPITINAIPSAITGITNVCVGNITSLSDITIGGTWSSNNTAIATIDTTGDLTGISAGVATISYVLSSGCWATTMVTTNPLPNAITGSSTICQGTTSPLSETTLGGAWSASNIINATIDNTTGLVTASLAGTDTITYTLGTGCIAIYPITINTSPSAITGINYVCSGAATMLNDASLGGTWSISNLSVATIDSTGLVTGILADTVTVTYALSSACFATTIVTVNPLPASITGSNTVCEGQTTTLNDTTLGGTWSVSNTLNATIDGLGNVTGILAGTDTVTYTTGGGCISIFAITVNPSPLPITGVPTICQLATITLSDATIGGNWMSLDTTIATISDSGVVIGLNAGTTTIAYTNSYGCMATIALSVNPLPASIIGSNTICVGSSTTLTDSTPSGSWYSNSTTIATITGLGGVVTGISAGTAIITYYFESGCSSLFSITVNPAPATITGSNNVCMGSSATLSDAVSGGSWVSSDTSIATTSGSGIVSSINTGTATITYTLPAGCFTTTSITVNPIPTAIFGTNFTCSGGTLTLTDTTMGGAWASVNTSIAAISDSGLVTTISGGIDTITYSLGFGCGAMYVITINQTPSIIAGATTICAGTTSILVDSVLGGTWQSSDSLIASVDNTGMISGISAGVATIIYTMPSGCNAFTAITVIAAPTAILGLDSLCLGASTTLIDSVAGGIFTSSNTAVATIDSFSGIVNSLDTGITTIVYNIGTSCAAMVNVVVSQNPTIIEGATLICASDTTTLTDSVAGGVWSSTGGIVAVSTTGFVTGLAGGSTIITYTLPSGCFTTFGITVNPLPDSGIITGLDTVCIGATLTLTDTASAGLGLWSSSDTTIATVAGGMVTGVSSGNASISYTVFNSCGTTTATKLIFVNSLPYVGSITGMDSVCPTATITLSDSVLGGVWSSANANATVIDSVVTGVLSGIDTINYAITNGCGTTTVSKIITINPAPNAGIIVGPDSLCAGSIIVLTDTTTGDSTWWSISNTNASIFLGEITGINAGLDTITFGVTSRCGMATTTMVITINSLPVAGTLIGLDSVCVAANISLIASAPMGIWSSSNNSLATVAAGIVTGVGAGIDTITYTVNTVSCGSAFVSQTINVLPLANPGIITGATNVCVGTTIILSDTTMGGTWSISNSNATFTNDTVAGLIPGADTITYSITNICGTVPTHKTVFIIAQPDAGTLTGLDSVCVGANTSFLDPAVGGTWSATNTLANVSSGIVSGVATGLDTIVYTFNNFCGTATTSKTVFVKPLPIAGTIISSKDSFCLGTTDTLYETSIQGTWGTTNANVMINPFVLGGLLIPIAVGKDTIIYSVTNTCGTATDSFVVSVNTVPAAPTVSGGNYVCIGGGKVDTLIGSPTGGIWLPINGNATMVADTAVGVMQGIDTIYYIINNLCGASSASVIINVFSKKYCDSIDSINYVYPLINTNQLAVKVYPNPSIGNFTIEMPEISANYTIEVYDIYGKMVATKAIAATGNNKIPFELHNLPNGSYMIKVVTEDAIYRQKIEIIR